MKGVKFNDSHSYYDLNLILSDSTISPAQPKTNYIDVPGADGSLDLTEALGDVKYNDRTGKLIFSVLPTDDFEEKKSEIANFLNGQKFKITFDKDPDWYYIGRCSINDHKCDKRVGKITVDLKLQPWKLKQNVTVVTFNAQQISQFPSFTLKNGRMPVIPTITVKATDENFASINYKGVDFVDLTNGTYKLLDFKLYEGDTKIELYAEGFDTEMTISYQEGSL